MATRRVRRRATTPAVVWHCLFCGSTLQARRDRFTCPRCHVVFLAGRNARGCVRQLAVDTCGAVPCCRELDQSCARQR